MAKKPRKSKSEVVKEAVAIFEADFEQCFSKYKAAVSGYDTEAAVVLSNMITKTLASRCAELTSFASNKAIEELTPKLEKATETCLARFTEASLTSMIDTLLQAQIEQLSLSILGLEKDTWSKNWKVDHCNGRMSALTELISFRVKDLVSSLIEEEVEKWFNGKDKQTYINNLRKGVESEIKDQIRAGSYRNIHQIAENLSNKIFSEAINNVLSDKCINSGALTESK